MSRYGWRFWNVTTDGILSAPFTEREVKKQFLFPTNEAQAVCGFSEQPLHEAPEETCMCGLYVMPTRASLAWYFGPLHVVTRVQMLGRVIGQNPWSPHGHLEVRAQSIRIVGPGYIAPSYARYAAQLEARYGFPFKTDQALDDEAGQETLQRAINDNPFAGLAAFKAAKPTTATKRKPAGLVLVAGTTDVLLQMRSNAVDHSGTWAFPGGFPGPGEEPADTALREALEEHGTLRACQPWPPLVVGVVEAPGYTYVLARTAQPPTTNREVPSTSIEAVAAAWVPADRVPNFDLHPALQKDWPVVRKALEAL